MPPFLAELPQLFALVVFRLAGLMMIAPVLGSDKLPRPIKLYIAVAMALCMCATIGEMPRPAAMPGSPWQLAVGLGGELAFGLLAGSMLSLGFVAARWAGGLAGQQMGFNMAGNFNPTADFGGSPLGDAYFFLAILLFLHMDGHHAMVLGIRESFEALPPLSVGLDRDGLELFTRMVAGATALALRIAGPVCVAMLVVDLSLGMLGKTIPALNLLSVGLSIRTMIGLTMVILGLAVTGSLLVGAMNDSLDLTRMLWHDEAAGAAANLR